MLKKIVNPYIKKPENKEWLLKNQETFLDYMAKHHSLIDCWHTVLSINTFDDAYVEKLITEVESAEKQKMKEERMRKAKLKGKPVSEMKEATAVEKKIAKMEEAAEAKAKDDWNDELPD